jgi:hypothetical protein
MEQIALEIFPKETSARLTAWQSGRLYLNTDKNKEGCNVAQVTEHLPGKHKASSSNSKTAKKNNTNKFGESLLGLYIQKQCR